jgi:hypothetical protein
VTTLLNSEPRLFDSWVLRGLGLLAVAAVVLSVCYFVQWLPYCATARSRARWTAALVVAFLGFFPYVLATSTTMNIGSLLGGPQSASAPVSSPPPALIDPAKVKVHYADEPSPGGTGR